MLQPLNYALKNTEYDPHLDEEMLDIAASKLQAVKDKYIANGLLNPKALTVNPSILKYQVPGGMLSNLMSQLKGQNALDKYDDVLREIPRVRKDMGYPPLVTPLSQMVGTQAVLNVISNKRYRIVAKEIKDYLRGRYAKYPSPVNEEIKKQIIGNENSITCRPADLLKPEFEELKEKYKDIAQSDEDVLSLALFESVATEFLKKKYHQEEDEIIEFEVNY